MNTNSCLHCFKQCRQPFVCWFNYLCLSAAAAVVSAAAVIIAAAAAEHKKDDDEKNDTPAIVSAKAWITHKNSSLYQMLSAPVMYLKRLSLRFIVHSMQMPEKCYKYGGLLISTVIAQ